MWFLQHIKSFYCAGTSMYYTFSSLNLRHKLPKSAISICSSGIYVANFNTGRKFHLYLYKRQPRSVLDPRRSSADKVLRADRSAAPLLGQQQPSRPEEPQTAPSSQAFLGERGFSCIAGCDSLRGSGAQFGQERKHPSLSGFLRPFPHF